MRIHRFYLEDIDINPENIIVTQETGLIHQLENVFRYKEGQKIHVFNEKVGEVEVEIYEITKKDMSFKYIRHIDNDSMDSEQKRHLTLYMSIIKNNNFEMVVEKAVELGVCEIIPIITERTIKTNLNLDRINRIIKESTEQCGRLNLMKIKEPQDLTRAISNVKEQGDIFYFGSIEHKDNYIIKNTNKNISVFIGPEGGFSESEINLFLKEKAEPMSLGKNILRAETAAIISCGLLNL